MTVEQYGSENDIADQNFLMHEYFENPAGDAVISLAYDDAQMTIAGQYIIWPMHFMVGNNKIKCAHSLNTLTGKQYRGQGIFTRLAEENYKTAYKDDIAFIYATPNPNSYPGFIKKLSFTELGRLPLMLRPLKPSQMVKEFLHSNLCLLYTSPSPRDA